MNIPLISGSHGPMSFERKELTERNETRAGLRRRLCAGAFPGTRAWTRAGPPPDLT